MQSRNCQLFKKLLLGLRGFVRWLNNSKTPFDTVKYVKKYASFYPKNYSEEKPINDCDDNITSEEETSYSALTGVWFICPKLHFYIFNFSHFNEIYSAITLPNSLTMAPNAIEETPSAIEETPSAIEETPSAIDNLSKLVLKTRETIIVVVHELSRTGAPILGVELAKKISLSANVIIVSLKHGPIEDIIKAIGIPYLILNSHNELVNIALLEKMIDHTGVTKAIINSICSHSVISVLENKKIPFVTLVHEYYSYANCPNIYWLIHEKSLAVIYPSEILKGDAMEGDPNLKKDHILVAPQGLICAPSHVNSKDDEERKIVEVFRGGLDDDACVIVGMGTIEPRKGVDLFISTAQSILRNYPSTRFRFVWIGHPLNNTLQNAYGVFLTEQIRRAGLSDSVRIMEPVQNLQLAFMEADIFFLSSRLDPLPLVSIEAMENGLPLVCFEGASGTASYLSESLNTSTSIVPYLDIESAANKIHELIIDPVERLNLGTIQQMYARKRFNMDKYTDVIMKQFG